MDILVWVVVGKCISIFDTEIVKCSGKLHSFRSKSLEKKFTELYRTCVWLILVCDVLIYLQGFFLIINFIKLRNPHLRRNIALGDRHLFLRRGRGCASVEPSPVFNTKCSRKQLRSDQDTWGWSLV